jgi:hypothetical protein
MSKFGGKDYILCLDDPGTKKSEKDIITNSAMDYIFFRRIPLSRRFTTRKRDTKSQGLLAWKTPAEFLPLTATSFLFCDKHDKLFIVAHATSLDVGSNTAHQLADLLYQCSLREIGLITFKACRVGSGDFLEEFVKRAADRGTAIGWAKGYKGSAATDWAPAEDRWSAKQVEEIKEQMPVEDGNRKPVTDRHGNQVYEERVLEGKERLKIVRGCLNPWGKQTFGRYGLRSTK